MMMMQVIIISPLDDDEQKNKRTPVAMIIQVMNFRVMVMLIIVAFRVLIRSSTDHRRQDGQESKTEMMWGEEDKHMLDVKGYDDHNGDDVC